MTCEYAQKFHGCIVSSSAAHRPTDLEVPGTDFEECLIGLSDEAKPLGAGIAERLVCVAVLSTSDGEGLVLVRIGTERDGQVAQQCLLPGGKMRKREGVSTAAARILETFLSPISGRVTFGPCER